MSNSVLSQTFSISGSKLIDANGNVFIMRGVNNPHIWIPGKSLKSLDIIAGLNANTVRIVWQIKGKPAKLESVIKGLKKSLPERYHNLIPMNEKALIRGEEIITEVQKAMG